MDVNDRDKKERDIARRLARVFGDHHEEIMELLGDPPSLMNVPEDYWQRYNVDIRTALSVPMNEIFFEQFTAQLEEFGLSFDDSTGSDEALNFIEKYTFELVKGIENTTREAIRKEVQYFIQNGDMTIQDLAERLYRYYSPVRAQMIAITETTRAAAQGELETIAKLHEQYGLEFEAVWQTANDERVCIICGPKHGKVITDGEYPPAHPNCRCWVNHRLKKNE